ncbi:MAG: hypothetical protein O3A95_03280 [Planctomycetota bacterium]|nr:hypothetical protein [Planctomycetota bacterium]MDA1113303.1 hypothetical protein [Planctomycetota bacterium]
MNKLTGFLLHDWRRKLLAVGIAFLIWSWVDGQISFDQEVALRLSVGHSEDSEENNLILSVKVPPGWVLTDPPTGASMPITLHGTNSEFNDFKSRQCNASISVTFEGDPLQDIKEYPISPEDFTWVRPSDAAYLLSGAKGGKQMQNLTFQRIATQPLSPNDHDVTIVGKPSDAHEARVEDVRFIPNQITLSGPKLAMQKLNEQINDAHSANGTRESSGLFASVTLSGNERDNVTKSLRLAQEWTLRGISMEPEQVLLELPVRFLPVAPFPWLPSADDLIVLPANDLASNGPWTMEAYEPTRWTAGLPNVDTDIEINAQWIEAHVELLLPMNTLNANSLDRTILPVRAHLFNFDDPEEEHFFRQHLVIRAEDPASATVTVTRNP